MQNLFIDLLNISITASYIIIAVILFRAVFRKVEEEERGHAHFSYSRVAVSSGL